MIQSIFIKNFKAFTKETIPVDSINILIGENDSGKTSVLQALDVLFNQEKVDKNFVREIGQPVEIGILINNSFLKKVYKGTTYKESLDDFVGDMTILQRYRYIYIPINSYDPKSLISQLATAKAIENTRPELLEEIKSISQDSISQVINSIDRELLIINGERTTLTGLEALKYDASIKFNVQSEGVPIESRGSGFQKNLMYALLVGNDYENVILGIDEIENSFSVTNCASLIQEIRNKIGQSLITTHSVKVLEISGGSRVIPIYGNASSRTLAKLLATLDDTNNKRFILVEGKFDVPWIERCILLLGRTSDFIVIPSGGQNNTDNIKRQLENEGKACIIIRDGDTNGENALLRECIELYTPLEAVNSTLNLNLTEIPMSKESFFNSAIIDNVRNDDSVKRILSIHVGDFLTIDNDLVQEVSNFITNI